MVQLGIFEGERVELLYGVIIRMSPKGPEHESALERLTEIFVPRVVGRGTVRIQSAFAASDGSEPEPDLAIVPRGDYRKEHPSRALLIVEVADSSLKYDRTEKAALYAESGVPEYWIVNVRDHVIEVHGEVVRDAYTRITPYRSGSTISLSAFPDVVVAVDDVFGRDG
jgi:Uma2 family endonuclease